MDPPAPRWPCRACGHRTLEAEPPGTWLVCSVCAWEDTPQDADDEACGWHGSNAVDLRTAQRNYAAFGAVEELYRDDVRAPLPGEERPAGWQSIDEAAERERAALLADIARAFDGVSRSGGVTLHETEVIDNYGSDAERAEARARDREGRWQDVPHADLAEICGIGGSAFFDPIGWRYYLPAYMTWWLTGGEGSGSLAAETLIYSLQLSSGDLRDYDLARYRTLDGAQAAAVARFLRYVLRYGDGYTGGEARSALTRYWAARE